MEVSAETLASFRLSGGADLECRMIASLDGLINHDLTIGSIEVLVNKVDGEDFYETWSRNRAEKIVPSAQVLDSFLACDVNLRQLIVEA